MQNLRNAFMLLVIFVAVPLMGGVSPNSDLKPATSDDRPRSFTMTPAHNALGRVPIFFEPNRGQFPERIHLAARSRRFIVYVAGQELIFKNRDVAPGIHQNGPTPDLLTANASLRFLGVNPGAAVDGFEQLPSHTNYFLGSDPSRWLTGIPNYASVRYDNLYSGISLVCYSRGDDLELDWIVAPGGDPSLIRFSVKGAVPRIERSGDLVIRQAAGEIRLKAPVIFQEKGRTHASVPGGFAFVAGKAVGFRIGKFDRSLPLVIDPVIVYSTWLGGSAGENPAGIGVDAAGDIYTAGTTSSVDFPVANPLQSTMAGDAVVYVTKFTLDGSALLYSTYLGGTDANHVDHDFAFFVDQSGNAYLTGGTNSSNFPTTSGAFQPPPAGSSNLYFHGFVTKLNATGSALVFSTYLGGSGEDSPSGITADQAGNVCVAGFTTSKDFPITAGAYQKTFNDTQGSSAFITKLNPAGSALVYSTFLGGSVNDEALSLAVDSSGNAYVAGQSWSPDFPSLASFGEFDGTWQAFVVKVNEDGSQLLYSSAFGSGIPSGIAVDSAGYAYVTGTADQYLFPTVGEFQGNCKDSYDAFVAKLDPTGSSLVYSMCIGGTDVEVGGPIALDAAGNAYISGRTQSYDFPLVNPIQAYYGGSESCAYPCSDAFVTEVSADGSRLLFSTYLGDSGFEQGNALAVDSQGNIYVTGYSDSDDFPVAHPFQATRKTTGEDKNAFITKISPDVSISPQRLVFGLHTFFPYLRQPLGVPTSPLSTTFTNNTTASVAFQEVQFSGPGATDYAVAQDTCSGSSVSPGGTCDVSVVFTPSAAGARDANLLLDASATGSPFVVLLRGYGMPLQISPLMVDFGVVQTGTTSPPQTVSITNVGSAAIHISSLSGDDPSEFLVQSDTCTGATLAPQGACAVSLTFTAPNYCNRQALLSINDDDPDSPQGIPLAATGSGSYANFSHIALTFLNQFLGTTSATQTDVMTNTGTSTMHIASISLTSSDFTQTNNCGATLAPGASCSFQVAFKPGRWGGYGEYLQLTGDMFGGAGSVLLGAEGEDFSLAVPTGKSASATVSRGQTATYTVNVAPSGGTANYNTTFACAGAPQEATCTVSPSSLTLGPTGSENVTVTVTTTAPSAVLFPAGPRFPAGIGSWPPLLSLIFLFLLATHVAVSCKPRRTQEHQLPPFVRRPNSTNPLPILYGLACVAFGVFLLAFAPSCGGGGASGNGGGGGGPTNPGTPSGNYTLTLTATATQGSATLSHSTSLSLTVQ